GGTGSGARGAGSNADSFDMVTGFELDQRSCKELLDAHADSVTGLPVVKKWLDGPKSLLVCQVDAMLTNWRAGVLLLDQLGEYVRLQNLSDMDAAIPGTVLHAIKVAVQRYRGLNGLSSLSPVEATARCQEALAFQTLALVEDIADDDVETWKLLSTSGLLRDEWAQTGAPAEKSLCCPRYVMSPALQVMTRLEMDSGRQPDAFGAFFEEEVGHFFLSLFRSAAIVRSRKPRFGVNALLRTDWDFVKKKPLPSDRHCFQYDYLESSPKNFEGFIGSTSRVPLLPRYSEPPKGKDWGYLCTYTHLKYSLQPRISLGDDSLVLKQLKSVLAVSPIVIVQNTPRAMFADVIVVNLLTKELWLIQCKSGKSTFGFAAELRKMGYPKPEDVPLSPQDGKWKAKAEEKGTPTSGEALTCSDDDADGEHDGDTDSLPPPAASDKNEGEAPLPEHCEAHAHPNTDGVSTAAEGADAPKAVTCSAALTEWLRKSLGLATVRYFLVVGTAHASVVHNGFPNIEEHRKWLNDNNIHLISNACGFAFDPIDITHIVKKPEPPRFVVDMYRPSQRNPEGREAAEADALLSRSSLV
ncbi:MAG: hypothetical protein Q7T55_02485, partial [Solirubrobacteraceae bacterium]|nr:hypothetical protein [Solirubrobacteraceae bacterium]